MSRMGPVPHKGPGLRHPHYAEPMTTGRDDDALSWDGDDDPTLVSRPVAPATSGAEDIEVVEVDTVVAPSAGADATAPESSAALPDGWNAVGRGSDAVTTVGDDPADLAVDEHRASNEHRASVETDEAAPANTNVALIATGVLAGVYLLYAIGWLIGGLRLQGRASYLVTDVMYQGSLWLAALAPVIWFGTVLFATRRSRPCLRYAWLAVGVLLLVPWPFIMIGAVGL